MSDRNDAATEVRSFATIPVKVFLALGGFAALAILLEGARSWSWWVGAVLAQWGIGGEPAAPEMFVYPAFFTAILALSRAKPQTGTPGFLALGLLWSTLLFIADPALRAAIHAVDPALVESNANRILRGTVLYALLFGWMYLTFRRLVPRTEAEVDDTPEKPAGERNSKPNEGTGNGGS